MNKPVINLTIDGVGFNARNAARKKKKDFIASADSNIWPKVDKKIREKLLGEAWEKCVAKVKEVDGDLAELASAD